MIVKYEYQIANMDVGTIEGVSDAVTAIHYRVVAKHDGVDIHPVYSGVVQLGRPGDNFVEFADLVKDQVEQWLKDAIDDAGIEAELASQVASLIEAQQVDRPQTSRLPPWMASK